MGSLARGVRLSRASTRRAEPTLRLTSRHLRMQLRRTSSSVVLLSVWTEPSRWSWRRLDSFRALAMVPSLAKPSTVVVEAMATEEDEVEDIMVEETMAMEEVLMVVMEVN